MRPDIIREKNCITVIELTCSFETNPLKSYDYKITKYQNLCNALLSPYLHFTLILLEISLILPDLQQKHSKLNPIKKHWLVAMVYVKRNYSKVESIEAASDLEKYIRSTFLLLMTIKFYRNFLISKYNFAYLLSWYTCKSTNDKKNT